MPPPPPPFPPAPSLAHPAAAKVPVPPAPLFSAKAVLFDLDGTLLSTEVLADEAMLLALDPPPSVLSRLGGFPPALKSTILGMTSTDWSPIVLDFFKPLYPPSSPLTLTPSSLASSWSRHLAVLCRKARCMPGAIDLVRSLSLSLVPLAIATSSHSSSLVAKSQAQPSLFSYIPTVVTGDDPAVIAGKPAPDIFLEAALRLNVPPSSCLVFEDSLAGCRSARAAGCFVIAVPDELTGPDQLSLFSAVADLVIPSLLHFDPALFDLPAGCLPPPLPSSILASWVETDTVDRHSLETLPVASFVEMYEKPGKPLIVTGAVPSWAGFTEWTRERLVERFGGTLFRVSATRDMEMGEFFEYVDKQAAMAERDRDKRPLYLFDKDFCRKAPAMAGEFEIPPYFEEDLMSCLGDDSDRPDYKWLIVGPQLSGSSFHVDPNANFAWNATIEGRKKWIFYPPECEPPRSEGDGRQVDLVSWFKEFYDADPHASKRLECVTTSGECMYVPRGWWHCVLNVDTCIAITHNVVTTQNLAEAVEFLENGAGAPCGEGEGCRGRDKFDLCGDVPTSVIYPYEKEIVEEGGEGGEEEEEEKRRRKRNKKRSREQEGAEESGEANRAPCACSLRTKSLLSRFLSNLHLKHPGLLEKAREERMKGKRVIVKRREKGGEGKGGEEEGGGFSFNFLP